MEFDLWSIEKREWAWQSWNSFVANKRERILCFFCHGVLNCSKERAFWLRGQWSTWVPMLADCRMRYCINGSSRHLLGLTLDSHSFFEKDIRLQLSLPDLWENFMVYVCLGGVNLSSFVQIIRLTYESYWVLFFVLPRMGSALWISTWISLYPCQTLLWWQVSIYIQKTLDWWF